MHVIVLYIVPEDCFGRSSNLPSALSQCLFSIFQTNLSVILFNRNIFYLIIAIVNAPIYEISDNF